MCVSNKILLYLLVVRAGTCRSIFQINFVSDDNKWEVFWVSRTGLDQELISPAVQGLECVGHSDIKHQYTAVGSTVKRYT